MPSLGIFPPLQCPLFGESHAGGLVHRHKDVLWLFGNRHPHSGVQFSRSPLHNGGSCIIRQFSSFLPLFGSLRHACLLGQKSSVECRYLGFNTEPFTYNKELAEEVLCYLKSYNRVTGRCRKGQRGPVTAATVMILIFDSL